MRCPVCQTEMVLELTKDGSQWWWCGVCEDEEPYTEFDGDQPRDDLNGPYAIGLLEGDEY